MNDTRLRVLYALVCAENAGIAKGKLEKVADLRTKIMVHTDNGVMPRPARLHVFIQVLCAG